jgi:TolB protein
MKAVGLSFMLIGLLLLHRGVGWAVEEMPDQMRGALAYVTPDGSILVHAFEDNDAPLRLNLDDEPQRYFLPTWSRSGDLAVFCCADGRSPALESQVLVVAEGEEDARIVLTLADRNVAYGYWSPRPCAGTGDCYNLALLSETSTGGAALDLLDLTTESLFNAARFDSGDLFFSWSPDGTRLLLNQQGLSPAIYAIGSGQLERLAVESGIYAAPGWSPVDDRLLLGLAGSTSDHTDIAIVTETSIRRVRTAINGRVAMGWSPDGNYLAYTAFSPSEPGNLHVIDAQTEAVIFSSAETEVVAFFWSPDSEKLAYITSAAPPGPAGTSFESAQAEADVPLAWSVVSLDDGLSRRYSTFVPTATMADLVALFDQYAQSHRVWSPNSRHLVFAELISDGRSVISVLDTSTLDTVPFTVAEGEIAFWSFE